MEGDRMKYMALLFMVLFFCGLVDSQSQGIEAKNCVKKCCVESGWAFDSVCDFGGGQPGEEFNQCLRTCMSDSGSGSGDGVQAQGSAPREIPEAAKACLKKCCDQIKGEYDQKSSYCNTDYDTSVTEGFQSCQMGCVSQNLQPKPIEGAANSANGQGATQADGNTSCGIPCISAILPIISILAAFTAGKF